MQLFYLSRRDFLEKGTAGGTLLALSALLPTGCAGAKARPTTGARSLKFFTADEAAVLSAAADAILPDPRDGYPPHPDVHLVERLDAELAQWEPVRSRDVHALLQLLEHGTRLFGYSWRRFSALALEERREYLKAWADSRLAIRRSAFLALKGLLTFYYFASPEVWPATGYDGPWLGRFDIPITPIEGLPG